MAVRWWLTISFFELMLLDGGLLFVFELRAARRLLTIFFCINVLLDGGSFRSMDASYFFFKLVDARWWIYIFFLLMAVLWRHAIFSKLWLLDGVLLFFSDQRPLDNGLLF